MLRPQFAVFVGSAFLIAAPCSVVCAQSDAPLRVIRTTPAADASPSSTITVTFDRPVAGSLDRTIDPRTILTITPAVQGKLEWRDPVTLRLTPSVLLQANTRYTVTVANNFRAMDGSQLTAPYTFGFRVQGPVFEAAFPGDDRARFSEHVAPNQRFLVVYSAPVDLAALSAAVYAEFNGACAGTRRIVRFRATTQRAISSDDAPQIRYARSERRGGADSLRRLVVVQPTSAMPYACGGELVVPAEVASDLPRGYARVPFRTYGELRLTPVECAWGNNFCPTGPIALKFTNPVRGSEVLRKVRLYPETKFTVRDTTNEATYWTLDARLSPRVSYAIVADTSLRDVFGQPLRGNPALGYRTTGYSPSVTYAFGRQTVERNGFRTLAVQHVNVDTLVARIAAVPDSLESRVLASVWGNAELYNSLMASAATVMVPVHANADKPGITGLALPVPTGSTTLFAVKVGGRSGGQDVATAGPIALVQVTDLGVHARVGKSDAVVWVTRLSTGASLSGVSVALHDAQGKRVAAGVTDAQGIVRFSDYAGAAKDDDAGDEEDYGGSFDGFVKATLGDDRAVTGVSSYDPDLSPWRFNVYSAWGDQRYPLAAAVFTERGIYRPGEPIYAKAIVRQGPLGALRVPTADSVKWIFHDREDGVLHETVARLSAFGTADQRLDVPASASLGQYGLEVQARYLGEWRKVAEASYRIAEYRPPEFLVDVANEGSAKFPGDTLRTLIQARYLFGAPMGRAALTWTAQQTPLSSWDLEIPNTDGWYVGESGNWWEERNDETQVFASGIDTLDTRGERAIRLAVPTLKRGRAARVSVQATVTDINRQVVGAHTSATVHPATFYIAAKPNGTNYFWTAKSPQSVSVMTVTPEGEKVAGVRVNGVVVRREWHRVRRERDGVSELVGEWVSDTVARCAVVTAAQPPACAFTPNAGGEYTVSFTATDEKGRVASTSFERWAAGSDWVPWSDETQFKMDVIPDKTRYAVGDVATIMFASPFTDADAWVTVEREGLIEQRRIRITAGATTLKFPITEAYAPNAFVSIIVARGRSAKPGPLDDPGRPTIRVGYAELRVTPEIKRLSVALEPLQAEYLPGDSARVNVRVRDAQGAGTRSEVTLWAVDEGVLALTGYKTPDPIDLIYRERGLGMHLASNMAAVAPQIPEGEKGQREAGGGGGAAGADVLRSRFQTTAFFLGSVITDAAGNATAVARLPDNLTTFRLMAVAVTAGDRYGKGDSKLLVTRPLLARAALPRFVRPADKFSAGTLVNRRDGAAVPVKVAVAATGVTLHGPAQQTTRLEPSRGAEVRFPFDALKGDSAAFRFDVSDDRNRDAVRVVIPVRPDYHPQATVAAGVLRDTSSVTMLLPSNVDATRSTLSLSIGGSPLASIHGMARNLRVYPYYCSEQVISTAVPLIALYRAQQQGSPVQLMRDPKAEIARAVDMLSRRQRADGGIGYWSNTDWTSGWLSAYAGMVLLDARDAGVAVDTMVLSRLAGFVNATLHADTTVAFQLANWFSRRDVWLGDKVAGVDFLSRMGRPVIAAENELLRNAAQLSLEDRARLAEVLARRGQVPTATLLLASAWAQVRVEGRKAVLPDTVGRNFYFASQMRPMARVLTATLAVNPDHPLIGPMVEALAQQQRAESMRWRWNTQDYASAVSALAAYDKVRRSQVVAGRRVRVRAGDRTILETTIDAPDAGRDSSVALAGLLAKVAEGQALRVSLDAGTGDAPIYFYLTVNEVPLTQPVSVEDNGIRVERWYEQMISATPITSAVEGDLVRVRLKITVPVTRNFVVVDDALPAGLEAVDLSLRTASAEAGPGVPPEDRQEDQQTWGYGRWDGGWWTPFDHREMRDDRVVYSATILWPGTYTASYVARATTVGTFIKPPAHAEEMYNPGVRGRSDGGTFTVLPRQ
jgi:uncharacterized protein YfaS (alpha-2-macroglobulin family)